MLPDVRMVRYVAALTIQFIRGSYAIRSVLQYRLFA